MKNNQKVSSWEKVLIARSPSRVTSKKLIHLMIDDFIEVHGDRVYGDDKAIIAGIGYLDDLAITVIAEEKGSNIEERIERNFGMPNPEGYRKAIRAMKQAEKFNRPLLTIIDTPGAYPGVDAEKRGQSTMIAQSLLEMADLNVPIINIVLSEGGSGGAIAIGVADYILMYENSVYSVISPEGFASILFKDATLAPEICDYIKLTASDLLNLGIINEVIKEDDEAFEKNSISLLKTSLKNKFLELLKKDKNILTDERYLKFRSIGIYEE